MQYVLGQTHRMIMEIQTGVHVYAKLHHLCDLFSQNGMGREIKTANCLFFDTTRTPTEQKLGSKANLREHLESPNECLELLIQPANYLLRSRELGIYCIAGAPGTPWLQ